jgi:capsular exopolysaccharide synthesis family protein
MELKEYLQTLWKWWWLIVLCTLCAGGASFTVSSMVSPVYEARVLLMSNQSTNTGLVDYSSLLGGQRVIETYQELLKTRPVLETTIANLDLPYSPQELAKHIEVSIIPETQLLDLRVEDTNPQRAADIANEMALTFILQSSTEQQLREIQQYEQILIEQMSVLEETIEESRAEIEQVRASPGLLTQAELAALQSSRSQQQAAYANLLSGYLNIRAMKSRLLDLVVAEPAQPPDEYIRPRKMLNTAVAVMAGGMIACAVAFLLEYLNDTLPDADQMEEALSLPSLGAIPLAKSWKRDGHARPQGEEWLIGEAFRILRTNIQFAGVDGNLRKLLVTSSGPEEGKTSVVTNLGAVMAQNDRKVLLVDADLRRSQLHHVLGVSNSTGLTSLLLNEAKQTNCILETDVPNLYVLPSGPLPPNPSELLGSQRMAQLIEELGSFADVILFDTPPVLACADAMVLASRTDGVVLVVDSRSTRREAATRALEMLRNAEGRVLGAILNRVNARSSGHYYYYHPNEGRSRKNLMGRWLGRDRRRQRTLGRARAGKERDLSA